MNVSSQIAHAQAELFGSGIFLIVALGFPTFGIDALVTGCFGLAFGFFGMIAVRRLWASRDFLKFLHSGRMLRVLMGAMVGAYLVGTSIVFWNMALVRFNYADLATVDDAAVLGFCLVLLSLLLGFVLALFEGVWRAKQEKP